MEGFIGITAWIIALIVGLIITIYLWIVIPARMARERGRSEVGWVLLTWCLSPIWTIILLAILGDTKKKIKEDIINELSEREE